MFQALRLAKVIRVAPAPAHVEPRKHIDLETVRAVIVNRMHVLRDYTRHVTLPVFRDELRIAGGKLSSRVRKLLVREPVLLDNTAQSRLREVLASNQALQTVHEFRERLRQMWSGANMSNEKLVQHLKDWIAQAEASRIKVLQDFAAIAARLRDAARLSCRSRPENEKARRKAGFFFRVRPKPDPQGLLLDLRFLVGDVLADLRVEFLDFHLVRMQALVLGRDVEVAGAGRDSSLTFSRMAILLDRSD